MSKIANTVLVIVLIAVLCCRSTEVGLAEESDYSRITTQTLTAPMPRVQPVQEYFYSPNEDWGGPEENPCAKEKRKDLNPFRFYTHIGTDYGRMGPGEKKISWRPHQVCVDLRSSGWAGMWHSLAGLDKEKNQYLDFMKCYPFVRDEFQPKCVGMIVRARGQGFLKLELKPVKGEPLWKDLQRIDTGDEWNEFRFDWSPAKLRKVKQLNWIAESGAELCIDSIRLRIDFPSVPFEKKVFLISYAKLARCYSPSDGIVKDRANWPAGDFDNIPTSGLFCLATCAAWKMGIVDEEFARKTLCKVHRTVSGLKTVNGLLPHFVVKRDGRYQICDCTEYSTADTSIYYHSMLLSAEMLREPKVLESVKTAIGKIKFDQLRKTSAGYISHGYKQDGTLLESYWDNWGGETALVLLLEGMSEGGMGSAKMSGTGEVFEGRGFIAEIQSLFYPQFSSEQPDAITHVNWLAARRALLKEQMDYFPGTWPKSEASTLGMYGLSPGEGFRGVGYAESGTKKDKLQLIHPHYILMSALLRESPAKTYDLLKTMQSKGLIPPWGMVENVTKDLDEYLPMLGSLNASFECISAYHLWAKETGEPDYIYEAAKSNVLTGTAIKAFYPYASQSVDLYAPR